VGSIETNPDQSRRLQRSPFGGQSLKLWSSRELWL
jgi:hypothetical protein